MAAACIFQHPGGLGRRYDKEIGTKICRFRVKRVASQLRATTSPSPPAIRPCAGPRAVCRPPPGPLPAVSRPPAPGPGPRAAGLTGRAAPPPGPHRPSSRPAPPPGPPSSRRASPRPGHNRRGRPALETSSARVPTGSRLNPWRGVRGVGRGSGRPHFM